MIDLNGEDFKGSGTIFNNGNAGAVEDVTITIEKREPSAPSTYPNYKLIVKDELGAINQGFYYFSPNTNATAEHNAKRETQEVSRVLHLARAVMGADYKFPAVSSANEAYDTLFKLVQDNLTGKTFNVFVTYGTISRPNKKGYMGLRYFDFIEPSGESSKFRIKPQDLMTRVEPDAQAATAGGAPATTPKTWGM